MQQKELPIDEAFNKLGNESFVCHWHKLEIIDHYINWLLNFYPIRQDFAYSFDVHGEKCQIENCPCNAEIKLIKHNTINGNPIKESLPIVR